MNAVFEWLLPERLRKRKPMDDEKIIPAFASIADNDPVYGVIIETMLDRYRSHMIEAFDATSTPQQVADAVIRAGEVSCLVNWLETERGRARAALENTK